MKLIIIQFILYPEYYEYGTTDTYCKAENIGNRKPFIANQIPPGNFEIIFKHGYTLLLKSPVFQLWGFFLLHHNIFQHRLSVQHPYNAVAVTGIMLGVGHHYYCGSLFVQIGEHFHYFIPVV